MLHVYLIRSELHPDRWYTGLTADPEARLREHNAGRAHHTAKYRPWRMVASFRFEQDDCAVSFERYLKSGSGRAFAKKHFW